MPAGISFYQAFQTGDEQDFLLRALSNNALQGDGPFTRAAEQQIAQLTACPEVLLTASCTHALEMAFLLLDLGPGDEVILPDFTFVSAATAVVRCGATPVFADCSASDMNLAPEGLARALSPSTKAVLVMHYGGMAADLPAIQTFCREHNLFLVEDAAHCIDARFEGQHLGTFGDLGALSFHATKNIQCGEGGALLVNRPDLADRAHIIREKGTNRRAFQQGRVAAYTWVDIGSSFLASELNAAYLCGQLPSTQQVTATRLEKWRQYREQLTALDQLQLLAPSGETQHNGHLFAVLLSDVEQRKLLSQFLADREIAAYFHYQSLSQSPAGRKFGRSVVKNETLALADRLVRLPLYPALSSSAQERVIQAIEDWCKR